MELKEALEIVIAYIDEEMAKNPKRELADISNYLEYIKAKI